MKPFMPNKDDRELDELFRKAAAENTSAQAGKEGVAGKEAVWSRLETQLDAAGQGARRHRAYGWWIFSLALLLMVLTASFFIWKNADKGTGIPVEQPAMVQSANKATPLTTHSKISRPSAQENEKKPENRLKISGRKTTVTVQKEKKGRGDHATTGRFQQLSSLPFSAFKNKTASAVPQKMAAFHSGIYKKDKNQPAVKLNRERLNSNKQPLKEKNKQQPDFSRWSLGFTAGPNWSGVKTHGWKAGVAGGLKLTYHISPKWAISSGILLSKILYNTPPGEYHPADNRWQNYDVKQINAKCIVWDVPLNIEYTLWSHKGNHLFLSTGMSSFWMKEEQYTYHYKTSAGSWKQWTKELYNQNQHLFSILNFSAGYQKDWQHVSLQVAPYLKVPLKGIGYGNVSLYGAGIHLTLQYRLK